MSKKEDQAKKKRDQEQRTKKLVSALTQHNVFLQRLSSSAVNKLTKALEDVTFTNAVEIQRLLDKMTDTERNLLAGSRYTTDRLKTFKDFFATIFKNMLGILKPLFFKDLEELAGYEQKYTAQLAGEKIKPDGARLSRVAIAVPFAGGVMASTVLPVLVSGFQGQAEKIIRDGITSGQTTTQIINRIIGTEAAAYGDGELQRTKNELDAIVRTTRAHVSNEVYMQTWSDLGYEYVKVVATLDGRTTLGCAALDGIVYKIGESFRKPPYHYRCRTVLVGCDKDGNVGGFRPFVADDRPVKEIPKDERDGKIGQVSAKTKYKAWFEDQDETFKRDVLGATRYKLYQSGGFAIDKFVDFGNGNRLFTLAELRKKDDTTFKQLGL